MENNCSNDTTHPLVQTLVTDPQLDFTPQLHHSLTSYRVTVEYQTCLVKVWAVARSCEHEIRMELPNGSKRPINYTLGIGENRLNIYIVHKSQQRILRTYHLHIYRPGLEEMTSSVTWEPEMNACQLIQDCSLPYIFGERCGLHGSDFTNWDHYQQTLEEYPPCQRDDTQGRWLVPCRRCSEPLSCDWREARWQMNGCRWSRLSPSETRQCLKRRKLLFVGDSTNRGVMYYLIQKVNGTLQRWRKVHDFDIYTDLNQGQGQTAAGFSYYPKYWVDVKRRPNLDQSLVRLVNRMQPLRNDGSTVIVIGGVQWLTSQQIRHMQSTMKWLGLNKAKLVYKTYNAGFTIINRTGGPGNVSRFTWLDQQNQLVIKEALRSAEVVDTFRMTMARYREYTRGVCACHFHTVKEVHDSTKLPSENGTRHPGHSSYLIQGQIHELYSEMILNRICSDDHR